VNDANIFYANIIKRIIHEKEDYKISNFDLISIFRVTFILENIS